MRLLALLLVLVPVLLARVAPALADDPPGEVTVRWEGVAAGLLKGEEPKEPYTTTFPRVPPENLRWLLYTGEIGEASKQVYETRRWLWAPTWSADELRMGVRYNAYPQFQTNGPPGAGGVLSFDSGSPTRLPSDLAFEFHGTLGFDALPGGNKVLWVTRSIPPLDPYTPFDPFAPPELFLVDAERMTAFKPVGLPGPAYPAENGTWSPDGAYVLLRVTDTQAPIPVGIVPRAFSIYSVSMADGTARLVKSQGTGVVSYSTGVWSPAAPYRVAFTQDGAMWVFDPLSGSRRRLTADKVFKDFDLPAWHDAQRVWIGNKLIDVTSGKVTTYEFGKPAAGVEISPDGRYAITFDFPRPFAADDVLACAQTKLPQNRVYVFDQATGAASPLKDCDGRSFIRFQWLGDSRHVVMMGSECSGCHDSNRLVVLKDVITGAETALTHGYEGGVWTVVSPDGEKVIVTGDKLRVYAVDGQLLTETDPPAGFGVTSAAWAPDSKRFSFVAGPTGIWGP